MSSFRSFAFLVVCVLVPGTALAVHDPDISDQESHCQIKASRNVGRFLTQKMRCIDGCQKRAYKDPSALADCSPPYGGSTFGCVQAAEGKWEGSIKSDCAKDCPECYSGGDCNAEAASKIAGAEAHVESLAVSVFCDDSASGDGLTRAEFKCQRTVARFLAKFEAKKMRCIEKCRQAEHKGKIAVGACDPVTDPKTLGCIERTEQSAVRRIDRRCESSQTPSADKPECYGGATSADWVAVGEGEVDAGTGAFYCGE